MCIYKGPSENCKDYKLTKLKTSDRKKIVEVHNTLRSEVALGKAQGMNKQFLPPASNMREIKWDDELESIAERWVLQCVPYEEPYQRDECRFVERFDVGQNIHTVFFVTPANTTFRAMIFQWFDEVSNFNISEFRSEGKVKPNAKDTSTLHFNQIIFSHLEYVGCAEILFTAKVKFVNASAIKLGYIKRFICNYGPLYNVEEDLYTIGKPCANCPTNWYCKKDIGLCSDIEFFETLERQEKTYLWGQQSQRRSKSRASHAINIYKPMLMLIVYFFKF